MRSSNVILDAWKHFGLFSMAMLAVSPARDSMAAAQNEAYRWSAELVAFDDATSTVTVKSRAVDPAALDLAKLSAGDRVIVAWSGIETAAGIRAITSKADASLGRLTLPVEYVSSDTEGRYVTFKVRIPAENAGAIKALPPGAWVTATSPYLATDSTEAVSSIRPYNDVH